MIEIQSPKEFEFTSQLSIFIVGGISNCPQWQKEFIELLDDVQLFALNPRRENFDVNNQHVEEDQIKWEHKHLKLASAYAFWFPAETVCPITLFELGMASAGSKRIFIGTHPEYSRIRDIRWQMLLQRPEIDVVHSLEDLAGQVKEWSSLASIT